MAGLAVSGARARVPADTLCGAALRHGLAAESSIFWTDGSYQSSVADPRADFSAEAAVFDRVATPHFSCAILVGGSMRCLSKDGVGTMADFPVPNLGAGRTFASVSAMSVGDTTTWCAVTDNNALKCWSAEKVMEAPQADDAAGTPPPLTPQFVPLPMDDPSSAMPNTWSAVQFGLVAAAAGGSDAGELVACAIDDTVGRPYCFRLDDALAWAAGATAPAGLAPVLVSETIPGGVSGARFHSADASTGLPVAWDVKRAPGPSGALVVSRVTMPSLTSAAVPPVTFHGPASQSCGLISDGGAACIDDTAVPPEQNSFRSENGRAAQCRVTDGSQVCIAVPATGAVECRNTLELANASARITTRAPPAGHAATAVCRPSSVPSAAVPEATAVDLSSASSLTTLSSSELAVFPNARVLALGPRLASIGDDAFDGLARLVSLDLSTTAITNIPSGAFGPLSALARLALPAGISTIEQGAFQGLSSLATLDLGATAVTSLPSGAFDGLTALRTLVLPAGLTALPPRALEPMTALRSLDLSRCPLTALPAGAFAGLGDVASLALPPTIQTIDQGAFQGMASLTSLDLSATAVTALPDGAFRGLDALESLALPPGLSSVAAGAFAGLPLLQALDLSATAVTALPDGAFRGADAPMTAVTLPAALTAVHPRALNGLEATSRLVIRSPGLAAIPAGAFDGMLVLETLEISTDTALSADCRSFRGLDTLRTLNITAAGGSALADGAAFLPGSLGSCDFASSVRTIALSGFNLTGAALSAKTHFRHTASLQTLSLTDCAGPPTLGPGLLTPLSALVTLDLRGCGVADLPRLTFASQEAMTSLDIRGNALTTVDSDAFASLFALRTVRFDAGQACRPGTAKAPLRPTRGEAVPLCVTCAIGSICPDGERSEPCPRDTYQPKRGQFNESACRACPGDLVTSTTGSTAATDCAAVTLACPPGRAGDPCRACEAGTASAGGDVRECETCQPGTVSARAAGSDECLPCPAGTFSPDEGAVTLQDCRPCGNGLVSQEGAETCRACPAGSRPSASGDACVSLPAGACGSAGAAAGDAGPSVVCLPGVPAAVPSAARMALALEALPIDAAAPAASTPGAAASTARMLSSVDARSGHFWLTDATSGAPLARPIGRALQSDDTAAADEDDEARKADGSLTDRAREQIQRALAANAQLVAWAVAASFLAFVLLLLIVPPCRGIVHVCLRLADQMATNHVQSEFAAIRRIKTPAGGFFSVAAVLAALAMSTSLVTEFAVANTARADGLQVFATGVPGATRAAAASGDMVIDALLRPAPFVSCDDAATLTVTVGSRAPRRSDEPEADLAPLRGIRTTAELAARTLLSEVDLGNGDTACWLRATCENCTFPAPAVVGIAAHWSAQIVPWRLATLSSEGVWVTVSGTAAPPAATNATALAALGGASGGAARRRLASQDESITVVPHLTTDARQTPATSTSGFVVQDTRARAAAYGDIESLRPGEGTEVRLALKTSAVIATVRLTSTYTLTQLLSAVVGVVVGILGSFGGLFGAFERFVGARIECLCGRTGLVDTEEDAAAMAAERATSAVRKAAAAASKNPKPVQTAGKPQAGPDGAASPSGEALGATREAEMVDNPSLSRLPSPSSESQEA